MNVNFLFLPSTRSSYCLHLFLPPPPITASLSAASPFITFHHFPGSYAFFTTQHNSQPPPPLLLLLLSCHIPSSLFPSSLCMSAGGPCWPCFGIPYKLRTPCFLPPPPPPASQGRVASPSKVQSWHVVRRVSVVNPTERGDEKEERLGHPPTLATATLINVITAVNVLNREQSSTTSLFFCCCCCSFMDGGP